LIPLSFTFTKILTISYPQYQTICISDNVPAKACLCRINLADHGPQSEGFWPSRMIRPVAMMFEFSRRSMRAHNWSESGSASPVPKPKDMEQFSLESL
jgi:hypothetical protein